MAESDVPAPSPAEELPPHTIAPAPQVSERPGPARPEAVSPVPSVRVDIRRSFTLGFTATVGVLVALWLATGLATLASVVVSVSLAGFLALALNPVVGWLQRHRLTKAMAITVVFAGFVLVFAGIIWVIVPMVVTQVVAFAAAVPQYLTDVKNSAWFQNFTQGPMQGLYDNMVAQVQAWMSDPNNLMAIGGGALGVGAGLINAISSTMIILVLTLYFLASLDQIKTALVRFAPAYDRPGLASLVDEITESVGAYVSGEVTLAVLNAAFTFILLSLLQMPFAPLMAFLALFVTLIPMIGSVLMWIIAGTVTLFTSWWAALIFAVVYFAYMQVEAYIITPRIMSKQVDVPGALVLIGAMAGGILLGLLGALVAVPVTASLLLILNRVTLPRQDAKLQPDL